MNSSRRWLVIATMSSWVIGLLWMVVLYVAPETPVISALGNLNLLIARLLLTLGAVFVVALLITTLVARRR
ncbi:hypothetical protein Acor_41320 [Acrocarpospora corrugata]|uniref:Uncharacterized protein n=1 Tax=Acrocarpospora corrugata TaxID=35763 RepID=A0A5M3VYW5_9ACTN|nr:cell division protein CrgA [Acrocarpospora corrugata]GES02067.1 hypothetical protein Acor_41320 [Acrocarpospora corrugata]